MSDRRKAAAASRKREQRQRDRALAQAGLMRLRVTVPVVEIGEYLRHGGFLAATAEDDPQTLAGGVEALLRWLVEHADDR